MFWPLSVVFVSFLFLRATTMLPMIAFALYKSCLFFYYSDFISSGDKIIFIFLAFYLVLIFSPKQLQLIKFIFMHISKHENDTLSEVGTKAKQRCWYICSSFKWFLNAQFVFNIVLFFSMFDERSVSCNDWRINLSLSSISANLCDKEQHCCSYHHQ